MRERDNSDQEDQEININRQSVIKFKDVGEEDELEREVSPENVYESFTFAPLHR